MLSFSGAGFGLAVAHDALHGAISEKPWVNRLGGYAFEVLGINGYMWKMGHNTIHHTYTNIQGIDVDLNISDLLRLSPHVPHRPVHRFQHWYAFPMYSLSVLIWVTLKDVLSFLNRDRGVYKPAEDPRAEQVTLVVGKLVFYGYTLVLPLWVLRIPAWQVCVGWLFLQLCLGTILGVLFQVAHLFEEATFPQPDASNHIEQAWVLHQFETTSNFSPDGWLFNWYAGGTNHQIVHHLYPKVCSVHYPALSKIIRKVALAHGVPYKEHASLFAAIRSHLRFLRRLVEGA